MRWIAIIILFGACEVSTSGGRSERTAKSSSSLESESDGAGGGCGGGGRATGAWRESGGGYRGVEWEVEERNPQQRDPEEAEQERRRLADSLGLLVKPVTPSERWGPWLAGSSLALDHRGVVWVADGHGDQVVRIQRASDNMTRHRTGGRPQEVVAGPHGRVFASLRREGRVVRLADEGRVRSERLGAEPFGLALDPDNDLLFVTLVTDRQVVALDAETLQERARADLTVSPRGVAWSPWTGSVFVTLGAPAGVRELGVTVEGPAVRFGRPKERRMNAPPDYHLWLNSWPTLAFAAAPSPSGERMIVPHSMADLTVPAGNPGPAYYAPPDQAAAQPTLSVVPLDRADDARVHTWWDGTLPPAYGTLGLLPRAVAHHPTRSVVFVAMQGTDRLFAYNGVRDQMAQRPLAALDVGAGPTGVAFTQDGRSAYVFCESDRRVDQLWVSADADTLGGGHLFGVARSFHLPETGEDPQIARGRRLFYSSTNPEQVDPGKVACAVCHLEGRTDGAAWLLPQGALNPPMLAGRLKDTAPFNWAGDKESLEDKIENAVMRMGGTGLPEEDVDALAAFLRDGLEPPPRPTPDPELESRVLDGKRVFESVEAGCTGCHPAPLYTDLGKHEIQGQVVDTPSLKYLFASAPYFHDGRYETLADLVRGIGDTMGRTSHLTQDELLGLMLYLKTL